MNAPAESLRFFGVVILAAATALLLHGRSRASAADRKKIRKFNSFPAGRFRLGFSFFGHELRAVALGPRPSEDEALEVAKFFWFTRGELRADHGAHAAIVFRDAGGRTLFSVGMARLGPDSGYRRTLFVFGDPLRPVRPMKTVPVDEVRDL